MTLHEIRTEHSPADVIARARVFFMRFGTPDTASQLDSDDSFLRLHLEVGEIVIGAMPQQGDTLVRGSASRAAHLLTSFLTTLGPAATVSRTICRKGERRSTTGLAEGAGSDDARGESRPITTIRAA
jgi:hypothetical protein